MSGNHVDRREFLATGVGLAAAIVEQRTGAGASPNDRIRLGIVGCGGAEHIC